MHQEIELTNSTERPIECTMRIHRIGLKNIVTKEKTSVIAKYNNGQTGVIATLIPEVQESILVDLVFSSEDKIYLSTTNDNTISMIVEEEYQAEYSDCSECINEEELEESKEASSAAEKKEEDLEEESDKYTEEYSDLSEDIPNIALSIIRICSNEYVLLEGNSMYTLCNLVSSTTDRVSICARVNSEEVTIANLVKNSIETVPISLEIDDTTEIELFLVGEGEVDIVGIQETRDSNYSTEYGIECECATECLCEGECPCKEECICDLNEEYTTDGTYHTSEDQIEDQSNTNQDLDSIKESDSIEINDMEMLTKDQVLNLVHSDTKNKENKKDKKDKTTKNKEDKKDKNKENETITENKENENEDDKQESTKRKSKEELKAEKRLQEKKQLKVKDIVKMKSFLKVSKTSQVRIRYTIHHNNELIERSNKKGITFRLGEGKMIKGLELGLEGMTIRSKREITIPPHLAYGSTRVGALPPNASPTYTVELLDIIQQ
ncbi:hypothetical protein NEOKW01_0973 [Nematocida sp. AWRm80]|nr:hypothetical protein NEOKW01_0973 [Nematocida sp. AWRm80]